VIKSLSRAIILMDRHCCLSHQKLIYITFTDDIYFTIFKDWEISLKKIHELLILQSLIFL